MFVGIPLMYEHIMSNIESHKINDIFIIIFYQGV